MLTASRKAPGRKSDIPGSATYTAANAEPTTVTSPNSMPSMVTTTTIVGGGPSVAHSSETAAQISSGGTLAANHEATTSSASLGTRGEIITSGSLVITRP